MKAVSVIIVSLILAAPFAGCGRKPIPTNIGVTGKDVVVILSSDKQFKQEVIAKVTAALHFKGIRVIRDATAAAGAYRAADYGAVVYFAEYWAWHTPRPAKRYFHRNGEASNIIFMITSGNPHVKIKKPFDAVTSASSRKEVERVAKELLARLDTIMGK